MKRKITRRRFVATTAAASATMIAAPFVAPLTPPANCRSASGTIGCRAPTMPPRRSSRNGRPRRRSRSQIDYITSQGDKNLLTIAAEAQARSGHDILAIPTWWPQAYAEQPEPVDDIMADADQAERRGQRHGRVSRQARRANGSAVPATIGSQIKGPCSRIDLMKQHAGIDVQAMYPVGPRPRPTTGRWRHSSRQRKRATRPASRSASASADHRTRSTPRARSSIRSAPQLVDAKGDITVKSDPVRQALEYCKKLASFFPPDAPAWDDASNNKWLVSGKGALIMNPPSAWAVAKRDAPQIAEQCWTHGFPSGPKGRFAPFLPYFWGDLELQQEQGGCKEPAGASVAASRRPRKWWRRAGGYDLPSLRKLDHAQDLGRGRAAQGHALSLPQPAQPPDPVDCGRAGAAQDRHQIYTQAIQTKMIVRASAGRGMEKTLAWAESEVEGFMRT